MVSPKRHLLKTLTYRIISTLFTFIVIWVTTGNATLGAGLSIMELVYKPVLYYFHERFWYKYISFGVKRQQYDSTD